MSVMLGDRAVTAVARRINEELPFPATLKVYKYERQQNLGDEYIAVNHLPFVHRGEVESGIVNVNVHVKRLENNQPNTSRLMEIVKAVLQLFPQDTYLDGAYYNFYADSRPTRDDDNTYYINLQFEVTFNDLNY